jgi:hypothetical protein
MPAAAMVPGKSQERMQRERDVTTWPSDESDGCPSKEGQDFTIEGSLMKKYKRN